MVDKSLNYGRNLIQKFLEASMPSAGVVVDLGAGHGDDLEIARRISNNAKLHAVECWPPYVQELESNGVTVLPLNIERDKLPFENESVDVVIANQVLEHAKEIFWIFHEVSRVLKNGGTFIIGVPNLASLHNRLLLVFGMQPTVIKSASAHVRGFTKQDLLNFANEPFPRGFEMTGYGGGNFYPFPPALAKPLARLIPSMAWGLFVTLRKTRSYDGEYLTFPIEQKLETNFYLGV